MKDAGLPASAGMTLISQRASLILVTVNNRVQQRRPTSRNREERQWRPFRHSRENDPRQRRSFEERPKRKSIRIIRTQFISDGSQLPSCDTLRQTA